MVFREVLYMLATATVTANISFVRDPGSIEEQWSSVSRDIGRHKRYPTSLRSRLHVVTKVVYDSRVRDLVAFSHGANNVDRFLKQYYAMLIAFIDKRFQSLRDQGTDIHFRGLNEMEYVNLEAISGMSNIPHYPSRGDPLRMTTCALKTLNCFTDSVQKDNWSKFDSIILLTGYDILDHKGWPGVDGLAYVNTICTKKSVAIVEFKAQYNNLRSAAHEIAHTLGAAHDGDQNSIEAAKCNPDDNFIMAPREFHPYDITTGKNWGNYSSCTNAMVQKTLRNLMIPVIAATRLKNCLSPRAGGSKAVMSRIAMQNFEYGSSVTLDEQCEGTGFIEGEASPDVIADETICQQGLRCVGRIPNPLFPRLRSEMKVIPYPGTACNAEGTMWCDEKECVPMKLW